MKTDQRIFLTKEQAKCLLSKDKRIHTFRNPNGMLIGADWSKKELLTAIDNAGQKGIELGGENCKNFKHALIIHTNGLLFVETDMTKVELLEKELSK